MVKTRFLLRKVLASLGIMLLLLSGSADALGLHRCAHHDALPGATTDTNDHHGHEEAPAETDAPAGCTCIGTCSTSGVAMAPTLASSIVDAPPVSFLTRATAPVFVAPLSAAFLLPYATAPPTAL